MSELLRNLKEQSNKTVTANGGITYSSTLTKLYDLFAQGAAMRGASDADCIVLFKNAYEEDPTMALKCLFYLRDIRGGQGERRFFRLAIKWLAIYHKKEMEHLIAFVSEYGRYDDLFELFGTGLKAEMMAYIKHVIDKNEDHLVYKWMPSINTSSKNTQERGRKFAREFGMTEREYRKMLSEGRKACHLVETLMSQNEWNKIAFDKLPSRAGILYSKAFARREETKERYAAFMSSSKTKVNAGTLYPYDVVAKAVSVMNIRDYWYGRTGNISLSDPERLAANKYWDNLTDYFNGATLNALCVCDTSGSMTNGYHSNIAPIDVAIALSLYTAERAKGPFQNHFISFSRTPKLIEVEGVDFCDKVARIYKQNLCENTDIERTFDLILTTAVDNHLTQDDLPENIIIVSDMQFDAATGYGWSRYSERTDTVMERIEHKWNMRGYKMPKLIFWNVNAASGYGNIPMKDKDGITFVSGASPSIFTSIMTGKTGIQLMYDALLNERYNAITSIYHTKNSF